MALAVLNPVPNFFDLDGTPLSDGFLYFGTANQNPVTVPTTVYWDAAGTQPVAQPVRTVNGFPSRTGSPAIIYASSDFSLLVLNKRGQSVLYGANSADFGNGASIAATAAAQVVLLRTDLANFSDPTKGDLLIGAKRSETGSVEHTLHASTQERAYHLVLDAGATGDGAADDSAELAIAAASGAKIIDGGGRTYRVVTKFTIATVGQRWQNMTLKFDGANTTRICDVTAADVTLMGITFDGNSKQPRASLVYVDANAARFKALGCTFKDLLGTAYGTNVLNQMCALNVNPYAVTDFLIEGCQFRNLRKYNDGSLTPAAVGLGFVGGIYFMVEDLTDPSGTAQPTPSRGIVRGCAFDTIETILASGLPPNDVDNFNDADAIRTYATTNPAGAQRLYLTIANCHFTKCGKRAVKLRASGTTFSDSTVVASLGAYPMTSILDMVNQCHASNINVIATAANAPYNAIVLFKLGDITNLPLSFGVDGLTCTHCQIGAQLISSGAVAMEGAYLRNITLPAVTDRGFFQSGTTPSSQKNLHISDFNVVGSGNNARGIVTTAAADNSGGWDLRDVRMENADFKMEGTNNRLTNVRITINSTSYAGFTASSGLVEVGGGKGLGGSNHINNLLIDASGINAGYLSATRPYLVLLYADSFNVNGISIKVPNGMGVTYPHYEGYGDDFRIFGFEYDGPGYCRQGHAVASLRWSVRGATRHGNGACTQSFWSLAAASQYYEFDDITDWRPTTATTIVSATATNGIANNVKTRSSNATPAVAGVAKITNVNTF